MAEEVRPDTSIPNGDANAIGKNTEVINESFLGLTRQPVRKNDYVYLGSWEKRQRHKARHNVIQQSKGCTVLHTGLISCSTGTSIRAREQKIESQLIEAKCRSIHQEVGYNASVDAWCAGADPQLVYESWGESQTATSK
jgi:hypothetical protein